MRGPEASDRAGWKGQRRPYGWGGGRRSCRRRCTKLPPAAASRRKATPARISSGSGIEVAFDGPSHSIVRVMMPLELSSDDPPLDPLDPSSPSPELLLEPAGSFGS